MFRFLFSIVSRVIAVAVVAFLGFAKLAQYIDILAALMIGGLGFFTLCCMVGAFAVADHKELHCEEPASMPENGFEGGAE